MMDACPVGRVFAEQLRRDERTSASSSGDQRGASDAETLARTDFRYLSDPDELQDIILRLLAKSPQDRPDDATEVAAELEASDADWQIHVYGGVGHAFTNPAATDRAGGMAFDEGADRRSWLAMKAFIEERSGVENQKRGGA